MKIQMQIRYIPITTHPAKYQLQNTMLQHDHESPTTMCCNRSIESIFWKKLMLSYNFFQIAMELIHFFHVSRKEICDIRI